MSYFFDYKRYSAWLGMMGLAACTVSGAGEPTASEGSSGPSAGEPTASEGSSGPSTGEQVSTTGEVATDSSGVVTASSAGTMASDSTWDTSGEETEVATCAERIAGVTAQLMKGPRCSLLVHIAPDGALEWHAACAPVPAEPVYNGESVREETVCCKDGALIGPDASPFIVHQLPAPPTAGGLAIFSNHTGARVFEATIGVEQPSISHPLAWQVSSLIGLGEGCGAPFTLDAASYDLVVDPSDPPPLGAAVLQQLSDTIATTVLPTALESVVVDRAFAIGYVEESGAAEPAFLVLFELSAK